MLYYVKLFDIFKNNIYIYIVKTKICYLILKYVISCYIVLCCIFVNYIKFYFIVLYKTIYHIQSSFIFY